MDRKPTAETRLQELTRISQSSRRMIGREIHGLKRKLDLPLRLRDSLRSHPTGWLGGSLVAGLATSMLLRRRKPSRPPAKKATSKLVSLTLTAARPLVKVWLGNKLKQWTTHAISRVQPSNAPFNINPEPSRPHVRPPGS